MRPFRFAPYSDLPAIVADLSFTQPKSLSWDDVSTFVRGLGLAHLESVSCHDRYEGPSVPPGAVKTNLRLTFRSAERTLEQDEVNREVRRLAEALASRPGVAVAGA